MKKTFTLGFIIISLIGFAQAKHLSGDSFYEKLNYLEAAKLYEIEIANTERSRELLEKVGDAYYFNTDMKAANKWYHLLITTYKNDVSPEYFFKYSQSLKGMGKLSAAKKWKRIFNEKNKRLSDSIIIQKEIFLKEIFNKKQEFELNNLSINTVFSDFAPAYYNNKLIYASEQDSSYFETTKYRINLPLFFNLYIGEINSKDLDVTSSEEFSKILNSKYHEATLCFSPDFKKVYYTSNNYNNRVYKKGVNRLKLYSAELIEGVEGKKQWENIKELPFNSDEYSVGHPTLSNDGAKLYFVSDMPGTIGESDIFVVDVLGGNKYSQPRNLGPKINTSSKEMFPYITNDKLYFASDGHQGIGGLDVFESNLNPVETPVNLGIPLNSVFDDFSFIINEQDNNGFICSNRNSGKGSDDIYFFKRIKAGNCKQHIRGYISNKLTGERIFNATVTLLNKDRDKLEKTETDTTGNYVFQADLICNTEYEISVKKEGYNNVEKTVSLTEKTNENLVPIGLDRIPDFIVEENGVLKIKVGTVYFDRNKYEIRKDAAIEFDKVVNLMSLYPEMIIKIESHTDSRGSEDYNLKLSDKRAKAARNYIISKGIRPQRIIEAKGFGETRLTNDCKNGLFCSESLHQLNRRSEFIILKM